jgi:putative hydrolase of the HAD superfamily
VLTTPLLEAFTRANAEIGVSADALGQAMPEIYAIALDRLGLPGDACAFVDDLEVNLPPARAAGMRTVHFRATDQAIAELDVLFAAVDGD